MARAPVTSRTIATQFQRLGKVVDLTGYSVDRASSGGGYRIVLAANGRHAELPRFHAREFRPARCFLSYLEGLTDMATAYRGTYRGKLTY